MGEVVINRKELEKVVKWLDDLRRDIEQISDKLDYVLHNESEPYNISAYDDIDGAICLIYMDCSRCPLNSACDFYKLECKEPKDCSTCTKIKVCAQNRSPALIKYLMEKGNGNDSTQITRVPEIEYLQEGRFLLLRRGGSEIKFEAQPEIVADGVKFRLRMVSPDEAQSKTNEEIAKAFGFQSMYLAEEKAVFVGEKADLHIVCRVERAVRQTDDGYIIAYLPRFALEFVLKF